MTDREEFENHKRELIKHNLETIRFLSNKKKPEREYCVCVTFLRCLGIDFSVAKLVSVTQRQNPPDVIFREARFEICDSFDKVRKPHDEARARVERSKRLRAVEDLDVPFKFRSPVAYSEVHGYVTDELTKKTLR